MTNCFFNTIKQAFTPKDFHAHFPDDPTEPLHPDVFNAYFHNLPHFVSLLFQLAEFIQSMCGYVKLNDGSEQAKNKGREMHHVASHVLVNNDRVNDRELGDCVNYLVTKEVKLEDMIKNGYYDGQGAFDLLLVLLCQFTGIEIHAHVCANVDKTFVYRRLNTLVQTKVFVKFTKGHASFVKRQDMPNKNPKKRKLTY